MAGALTAMIAAAFSGVTPDPYFEYTTLLLPGSGTNGAQNNSFVDSSANAFPITRNPLTGPNAPTQGTFSPFSQTGWGNYFDGASDYLTLASNAAFSFGTGSFTYETWFYSTGTTSAANVFYDLSNANGAGSFSVFTTGGVLYIRIGGTGNDLTYTLTSSWINTWHHLAVVRNGTTLTVYLDGTSVATGTRAQDVTQSTPYIGDSINALAGYSFGGYLSNTRVVKGTAVYTGNFTPPTSPLTAISGTSLLTCQSNRFIDNSSNNFTVTRNGDIRVVAFSPFNPTASWSAATYGGSGYFDGSGDYLSVADNAALELGSSSFCIEVMYYPTSLPAAQAIFNKQPNPSTDYGFRLLAFNGVLTPYISSGNTSDDIVNGTTFGTLQLNAWNHIAIYRVGTAIYGSLNGTITTLNASTSLSVWNNTAPWNIGATNTGTSGSTGYFSNWRIVIGSGVYTSSSAPVPTSPLTAITNTALLLNFTNAGIYDATSKNDLETVGNAQISTTQSKWGGSSMSFDGTGDYLLAPSNALYSFGTGVFTVECWLYINSLPGVVGGIVDTATTASSGRFSLVLYASGKIYVDNNTNLLISTSSLATGSWYHLAVVRTGTGTNQTSLYINGVQDKTATIATDFTNNNLRVGTTFDNYNLNGYIQDLRITRGYARYTANFTPPTAAFPTL